MKRALEVLNQLVADGVPRPLSEKQYAKTVGRRNLAALPYPEKVKCVIELQKRLQPIYAKRGIVIKPWKSWK